MLAHTLPALPDTADELLSNCKASRRTVPETSISVCDASVTTVKHAHLADYRIIYFATHGLVAGEVKGLAEPALVLTLPAKPTADDDGLLKTSDVAQLKLNADWVVLSACNTVAGDRPGQKPCPVLRAHSSMPARVHCWCRIGRWPRMRQRA